MKRKENGECGACLKYSVSIFVESIFKMQLLEVSCVARHIYIYMSLGAKGLINWWGGMFLLEKRKIIFGFENLRGFSLELLLVG